MGRRAFTLTEMLVCIAIIAALAALLFPVFREAKESARETQCFSNHRQIAVAANLYLQDYDEGFMPVSYSAGNPNPNSRNDRTWVQLLLPYVRSFSVFRDPSDESPRPTDEASFDQDLIPGDTYSRFYSASLRTNAGYNYLYLSPVEWYQGAWSVKPRSMAGIEESGKMILVADSVFSRDENGRPVGGGRLTVIPPCRFRSVNGIRFDTFPVTVAGAPVYADSEGWAIKEDKSALRFGGVWGWHKGRATVSYVDGSVRSVLPSQLANGCRIGDGWSGSIADTSSYVWDSL